MLNEVQDHVLKRYQIIERVGKGAYGMVWKAVDRRVRRVVAIKKIIEAFHNAADAQRTYREIMILKQLNGHENIVRILNVYRSQQSRDIYIVYQHMDTDLHIVIKSSVASDEQKLYLIYQLLKGIRFLHQANVVHRDIKPSNLLVGQDCTLKLADFGLSRTYNPTCEMTDYVATRWYRAPEILLGSTRYGKPSDIWGVGCTIVELMIGESLFKGTNTISQIQRILEFTGKPSAQDLAGIDSLLAEDIVSSLSITKKKFNFSTYISNQSLIKIIEGSLMLNPKKRMTAEEALGAECMLPFLLKDQNFFDAAPIKLALDDSSKLSLREYREELYKELLAREKEVSRKWRNYLLSKLDLQLHTD